MLLGWDYELHMLFAWNKQFLCFERDSITWLVVRSGWFHASIWRTRPCTIVKWGAVEGTHTTFNIRSDTQICSLSLFISRLAQSLAFIGKGWREESSHDCTAASLVRCHGGEKRVLLLLCAKGSVQLRAMLASVMAVTLKLKSQWLKVMLHLWAFTRHKRKVSLTHTKQASYLFKVIKWLPPPHTQLTDAHNHENICDTVDNEAGASTEYTHATGSLEPTPIGEWSGKVLRHNDFLPYSHKPKDFHEF